MESNELLASLAKMEASLNEVESARKQVESTVNASSELQKEVREYVSAVKALCASLQSWASDLRAREGALSREYGEHVQLVPELVLVIVLLVHLGIEQLHHLYHCRRLLAALLPVFDGAQVLNHLPHVAAVFRHFHLSPRSIVVESQYFVVS